MLSRWLKRRSNSLMEMSWSPMLVVSILFHLGVFSMILFLPESMSTTTRPLGSPVFEVGLVELPKATIPKKAPPSRVKNEKVKSVAPKREGAKRIPPQIKEKKKKPVVIAKRTAKKKKSTTNKPKVSPSKLIAKAISKIEKKVKTEYNPPTPTPEPKPEPPKEAPKVNAEDEAHVNKAISRLQGSVAGRAGFGKRRSAVGVGIAILLYQQEVKRVIVGNWSYPVAALGRKNWEAVIVLRVKRDGTIQKWNFVKRSSDSVFDQSIKRAIERSKLLPSLPEGYPKSYEEIEIKFNLEDLQTG